MRYKISPPDAIHTTVQLPASKSMSNRALILNALSLSTYNIRNLSDCEDTRVIIDAFNSDSNVFDVKGAGTAMRFLTAFLAGMEGEWIIKGSKRMHERPIHP
ncbi:MAG: 3-phosphoshikimate 1-carboxyvinyltransferase, partial [Proteiniphilum sp.]